MLPDAPEHMRLDPDEDVYYPGDTITCEADGNPELQTDGYQWISLNNTSDVTDGPVLAISDDMVDWRFIYRCQACNQYLDQLQCATLDKLFSVSGEFCQMLSLIC